MFVLPPNKQSPIGQLDLRRHNTAAVLRLIWEEGLSRADVSRRTGLSRSTVTGIVQQLIDLGLVAEGPCQRSKGGRPPTLLRVVEDFRHLVGVELGASHCSVVLTDLRGRILRRADADLDVQQDPVGTQACMIKLIEAVLAAQGLDNADLAGIGLAVPCPLSGPDRLDPNILPRWQDQTPAAMLAEIFGVPVITENDANLGALAELWWGAGKDVGDFCYIKVATGVGAGHIIGGSVYRGAGGIAGEIGHTAIDPNGPLCRCGLRGCLEAMVGREQLERRLGMPLQTIIQAAHAREPVVLKGLAEAGEYLGIAVANLLNLLNPSRVVIGGALTHAGDALLEPIRNGARRRALFTSVENSRVVFSELGEDAVALGAATSLLQAALNDHNLLTNPPAHRRHPMEAV